MAKYNSEHKLTEFRVGEQVLLKAVASGSRSENTVAKFGRLFNGLFVLSEQVGKNTFIVKRCNNERVIGFTRLLCGSILQNNGMQDNTECGGTIMWMHGLMLVQLYIYICALSVSDITVELS